MSTVEANFGLRLVRRHQLGKCSDMSTSISKKQFLAQPATTAGVERYFKGCTQLHDDLRKSFKEDSLEAFLFAAE